MTESGDPLPLRTIIVSLVCILFGFAIPGNAQELACAEVVDRALLEISENCQNLERDSLCYGYGNVAARFTSGFDAASFSEPGARAPLAALERLQTSGLELEAQTLGVAVMNLQAHLPNTRPGSGVIAMLVGEAALTNEVDPTLIQKIRDPISTATTKSATLFAQPNTIAEESERLPAGSIVLVDAVTSEREWMRVVKDDRVTWAQSDDLERLRAMDSLPVIDVGDPFALQSFTFTSATELPECAEAEPMLVLQTPAETDANLTINGVDIHIGSLVSLQQVHSNAVGMTVHRGSVTTAFGDTIMAGNAVIGIMGQTEEGKPAILAWSGALPASETELARGERVQIALNGLARNNGWDEFDTEMVAGHVVHTVEYGDYLYAIARLYQVHVADIIAANGRSAGSRLYVGDELIIPNPGSGFGGLSTVTSAAPEKTLPSGPDCSQLRLTSPRDVATGIPSPYYWDGIPAANGYQINVFDHGSGSQVGTFRTAGNVTTVNISAGQLGIGGALQWEVIALVDGQPICSTGKSAALAHVSS